MRSFAIALAGGAGPITLETEFFRTVCRGAPRVARNRMADPGTWPASDYAKRVRTRAKPVVARVRADASS
jgi:hypothetical protein